MISKNFAVILGVLFFAALAVAGNLEVSSTNYDVAPASPGGTIILWAHVFNNSNGISEKGIVNLKFKSAGGSEFPFSLAIGEAAQKNLGNVLANQTALVSYKILVDPKTPDGSYTLYIETGENSNIEKSTPISIIVLKRKPALMVVSSSPTSAEIGKTASLQLILQNTGNSNALNISIGLAEDRTVTTTGIIVERDIVPLGAAFSNIKSLKIDETASAQIPLMINPSATAKAYYIPLTLTFYDENRTKYTQTEYVGIKVLDNAELGASISDITPLLAAGQKSAITVDIFNTGTGTAKYLTLSAKADFATFKQGNFFIGTLNSDDSDNLTLNATVPITENAGLHTLEITMKFKNEFGEEQEIVQKIPVMLYTPAEIASQTSQQTPWTLYLIAILAIVGIAYLIFGRKKKK
ncbi:MAG: hypothetical protein Q7R70_01295 [Candidatus Diapherotrites archaeon]|nr:hypothetical protein [Candidatus Diapherotrites archaeon]